MNPSMNHRGDGSCASYETVIGLEVHAQMLTQSKLFCGCSTRFGAAANTQICPVCAAFPGVLPVLNRAAVDMAIRTGLAIGGRINLHSEFSRKNYFYPDLPAGYQISQYELPVVESGQVWVEAMPGHRRPIGITRIHMEVDAGKNLHEGIPGASWVDLNRTGIPLMEIVSEPDLRSSAEAVEYLKNLRAILRYLQVCDGNMEEGSFRCDANVSVRPMGSSQLGTRCELKNLNSIRHVARAIDHEVMRQIDLIESGGRVVQETRLWDTQQNLTRSMRSKEEAHDYRYFPEPDLPPLRIEPERIERLQLTLPELPDARRARFEQQYGLPASDAGVLVSARELADFYEQAVEQTRAIPAQEAQPDDLKQRAKLVANWVTGDLLAALNKDNLEIDASPVTAGQLASLIGLIQQGIISGKIAKEIFGHMLIEGGTPESWVDRLGLRQLSDTSALAEAVDRVLQETPDEVQRYRAGQVKLLAFFVGRVMKATQGKANPGEVNRLLKERLGS